MISNNKCQTLTLESDMEDGHMSCSEETPVLPPGSDSPSSPDTRWPLSPSSDPVRQTPGPEWSGSQEDSNVPKAGIQEKVRGMVRGPYGPYFPSSCFLSPFLPEGAAPSQPDVL